MNRNVQYFLDLLIGITEKELQARYKNTIFGFLWLVVNPLLQMIVIGFVFKYFIREPIPYYEFHLFAGLLIWNFFSLSLQKTTPCIVFERTLIKKAAFPRAVIPLSIIVSNFVNLLIAFTFFLIPLIILRLVTPVGLVVSVLALLMLVLFTTGASLLTSALNVRFRDINFFVQALLIVWFYATPILYSLSLIPRDLLWLWRFNPMTSIMQLLQYGLVGGSMPGPAMLTSNTVVILVTLTAGIAVFRKESKYFDDWI